MSYFVKAGIFPKDQKGGLPIRDILRKLDKEKKLHLIPFVSAERKQVNVNWFFQRRSGSPAVQAPSLTERTSPQRAIGKKTVKSRKDSDETYVLDLCDTILNAESLRQHKFDFLVGDSGKRLPVDGFYPALNLVIEFREYQHTNPVKHFDKPDKLTVSGVHRGLQRALYDARRREVLPKQGIKLIEINYTDLSNDGRRLIRDQRKDTTRLKDILDNHRSS